MTNKRQRKRLPPVSLSPLEPEEALAGLLQVKPEAKDSEAEQEAENEKPESGRPCVR